MTPDEIEKRVADLVDKYLQPVPQLDGKPAGRNLYRRIIKLMNANTMGSLSDLVERARGGDKDAKDADGALCLEAARRISAGEKIEAPLADYITEILLRRGFKYKRTPKADKNLSRDLCVLGVLLELNKEGIQPTQNREPIGMRSGASYLADELTRRGIQTKAGAIEEVWRDRYTILQINPD